MRMIQPLLDLGEPLTNPLIALCLVLLATVLARRGASPRVRVASLFFAATALAVIYHLLARGPAWDRWLAAMNSPLVAVFLLIIYPAVMLPRGRGYRFFLLLPAAALFMAAASVWDAYGAVPDGREGFYWFLIRPAWLMGGVASALVLMQPFMSLPRFRLCVRLACLLVLVWGGFMFRKSYDDYEGMMKRRRTGAQGIMNVSETSPVLQHDRRMTYLPSAPCRFTADGGYVQGCNMELAQRVMQVNYKQLAARDPGAVNAMTVLGGTLTLFLVMCLVGARWFCGWLCPLSTLGSALDAVRRTLEISHWKMAGPVRWTWLGLGVALAVVTLAMAASVPYLDAEGKMAGVKIPLYPFCKICPSQQVCPVVGRGPGEYAGLPTADWGFGFFRYGCLGLLAVYGVSFLTSRRLWCRLCPMGMISGVFNRGGMFRLLKNPQKCNRCGMCAEVCPMDIDVVRAEMEHRDVSSYDCVLCLKCVETCPRDGCLSLEHSGVTIVESRFEAPVK